MLGPNEVCCSFSCFFVLSCFPPNTGICILRGKSPAFDSFSLLFWQIMKICHCCRKKGWRVKLVLRMLQLKPLTSGKSSWHIFVISYFSIQLFSSILCLHLCIRDWIDIEITKIDFHFQCFSLLQHWATGEQWHPWGAGSGEQWGAWDRERFIT